MFKNYLTYQLGLGFERSCRTLELPTPPQKDRLLRSAGDLIRNLGRSIETKDPIEESRCLFVSLTCLRDCRELLAKAGVTSFDLLGPAEVLHARLEQLCWEASASEKGQLRMLG